MKKLIIFFLLTSLVKPVLGQTDYKEYEADTGTGNKTTGKDTPLNVIRCNVSTLAMVPNLEYERVINKKFSFQIAAGYRHINVNTLYIDPELIDKVDFYQSGITIVPELKYYWTHFSKKMQNPFGAYLAPYIRIGQYTMQLEDNVYAGDYNLTYELSAISGGFVFGFQLLAGNTFALDAFVGPQLKYKKITNVQWEHPSSANDGVVTITTSGVTYEPRIGLSLGIAF